MMFCSLNCLDPYPNPEAGPLLRTFPVVGIAFALLVYKTKYSYFD